ncbi:hypothetical protein M885DRAFT_263084 [Pelagophyceae sp. CCMP2097]|nr:hypothetical protein M885DRAFT_263084 [Pelagophyceae sp. CCMP2097]
MSPRLRLQVEEPGHEKSPGLPRAPRGLGPRGQRGPEVALRGRTVVWQQSDAYFSSDQLTGGDCHVYMDRCAAAIKLVQTNPGAHCVNVDDQFAIMPFNVAPTFFGRKPPLSGAVHATNFSHAFLASNWMINACKKECVRGFCEGDLTSNLAAHSTPVYLLPIRITLAGPGTRGNAREPRNSTPVNCGNFTN